MRTKAIQLLVFIPASILFFAAVSKIISLNASIESVSFSLALFSLSSNLLSVSVTAVLISAEIFASAALIIRKWNLFPLVFASFLFLGFIFFNIYKLIQTGDNNCGCFGDMLNADTSSILIIDIICLTNN